MTAHEVTVGTLIERRTRQYAALPLFRAFAEDRVPVARFPEFFKEQYMAARWFQDLIWATTEIDRGPYAAFARDHRRRDSGHHRWMKHDLESFGLPSMTDDDFFALEMLPSRIQLARILGRCHEATPEERMVILASLESAGEVTLGTLFGYVARNGLAAKTKYLGAPHVAIEAQQTESIRAIAAPLMDGADPSLCAVVELVFDALTSMFSAGGYRYYGDCLERRPELGAPS
ncbi:MAG: hypothetical protein NVSMB47_04640 [Polyangiales bacterium]